MKTLLQRLWKATLAQVVSADPWEPEIRPGEFLIRQRGEGDVEPVGRPLVLCPSAKAAFDAIVKMKLSHYWLTAKTEDGQYESANEKNAFRLLWQRMPVNSPAEVVQAFLEREVKVARAA